MRLLAALVVLLVVLAGILGPQTFFVVDETRLAILTRFGEPRRSMTEPGLYVKTPFIDRVTYFDRRLIVFDTAPDSLLTLDKRRLIIDVYARGRIVEPLLFFRTVRTEQGARARVTDIVASELRREIALDEQAQIIRTSREAIMNRVRDAVAPRVREFGIEIVDVRIKRADFPQEVAESIYARMEAERVRIANRERAEGAERDAQIRAEVDRQATIIRAEAQRDANIIRGQGEAEAISIFAQALGQSPEFYAFQRSLEAYKKFLTQNTTVVLPADSDLLRFLQSPTGVGPGLTLSQAMAAETAARQLLSSRMGIDARAPVLTRIERVDWSNPSLGCPEPGRSYPDVIVPGYALVFEYNGGQHKVHSNLDGSQVVACVS